MKEKSIVGDLIDFRGLVYSPVNENGVIVGSNFNNSMSSDSVVLNGVEGKLSPGADGNTYFYPEYNSSNASTIEIVSYIIWCIIWNFTTPPLTPNLVLPPGQEPPIIITKLRGTKGDIYV